MPDALPRRAGKRGVRLAPPRPNLLLSRFRAAPLTPPPPSGDVTQGRTDWGMDENDRYSCCGVAATDHNVMAKIGPTAHPGLLGGVGVLPLYFEYGESMGWGPQADQGVTNATWLKFLFDKGVVEAFAQVDHTDANAVHQAMLDFAGVLVGVQLTDDAEQLFEQHQPWTTALGEQADPQEGHDILLVRYDANGETFVTWGGLQASTIAWNGSCITECWVILTKEDAARTGVDLAALKAEIEAWS